MKISATDVVLVAKDAGFEGNQLRIAVAVSFAEDFSHDTDATGKVGEIGLWQIYPKAWPQFTNLKDPFANGRAAFQISQHESKHWNFWSTWNNGSAQARLLDASATIAIVQSWDTAKFNDERVNLANKIATGDSSLHTSKVGNPPALNIGIPNPLDAVGNAVKFLSVGENWGRLAKIALGGILVVAALNILAKPVVEPIIGTAVKGVKLAAK